MARELTPGQLKILQAVAVLLENPAHKLTINLIAQEIQVTEGAIYRHFRSKEAIFEAIMNYLESNLITPLNAIQQQSTDSQYRLEQLFKTYMNFLEGHPGFCRLLLGAGASEAPTVADRLKLLHAKIRSQLNQIFKFGQAQGDIQRQLSPELATEQFYGQLMGAAAALAYNLPHVSSNTRWQILTNSFFPIEAV